MNNDFLNKIMNIDDVVLLRHLDTLYPVGIGAIIIRFIYSVLMAIFDGRLSVILSEIILVAFLLVAWRILCEILYCVGPDDKR
ncbi:MAG: hypothetical protein BWY78_00721 [Alphaproteobacteria bacterium ADurb.Bin438]|nr:MAG: hypothetical protein BWY78_00721 [Alphaproteobacteria bacterium ADurb.Bin438]